nr:RNA-directed DNA polymerase, eukaryota [Tanacetum cinerariifolium]
MLNPSEDRWSYDLNGSGEFSVASARRYVDNNRLPDISSKTRWTKEVPIKVNVHAWKVRINGLPTRWNISRRGIDIPSILCPLCETGVESSKHLFFNCSVVRAIFRRVCIWWDNDYSKLLVYCGKDVCEDKCTAFKGKKPKDKHDHVECTNSKIGDSSSKIDHAECCSKPATKKNSRTSQTMKESWSNKKEYEKKILQKSVPCPFRVENKDNWAWFLSLLQEDLKLGYGRGLTLFLMDTRGYLNMGGARNLC